MIESEKIETKKGNSISSVSIVVIITFFPQIISYILDVKCWYILCN